MAKVTQRLRRLSRNPTFQAVTVSFVIALLIYGPHLFDLGVPCAADAPFHILTIDTLHHSWIHGSWPDWIQWWYQGFPPLQYYPPGFHILGAVLTFITTNAVISYKLLLFFGLMSNGLVIYYFSRRFLQFSSAASILSLIAYESSYFILINYSMGAGPNLLGWSISILFLTAYLCNVTEGRVRGVKAVIYPSILFGIMVLIHPFPVIFAILAVIIFHILEFVRSKQRRVTGKAQLTYFVLVFGIGALLSIAYWLPFLLTHDYVSPLYTRTYEFLGTTGTGTLVFLTAFALVTGLITRWKLRNNAKLDLMLVYFILAAALGFGLAHYLPIIGKLVHDFRFATIAVPFFGVLLIVFPLDHLLKSDKMRRYRRLFITTGVACLMVVVVILPPILIHVQGGWMGEASSIGKLFLYVENYRRPDYAALLKLVQDGRLLVPATKGGRAYETDFPVTFGWRYGVVNVRGNYCQGDPNFFSYTFHLEWHERWLNYEFTRENLMQEGGAKYLFIRNPNEPYQNMEGMERIVNNDYGQLWRLGAEVAHAASVNPILLDVSHPQQVTDFFNILVPGGYKMVFIDIGEVDEDMKGKFDYVMVDDEAKLSDYEDKNSFLLYNEDASGNMVSIDGRRVTLRFPYLDYANRFFYQGELGVKAQIAFDRDPDNYLTPEAAAAVQELGTELEPVIDELGYNAANYEFSENEIRVDAEPGFTLIKDTYFPYWGIERGQILSTTQGFMLTYSDDASILLRYQKPAVNTASTMISLLFFAGAIAVLGISAFKSRKG